MADDDWNPNAPDMNNDFNQVNETQEQEIEREPVSKIELDMLKEQREIPKPELNYTPGGTIEQEVHTNLSQERETRINYIEERLDSYQDKARNDFNMTQQEQDMKEIEQNQGQSF